MRTVRLYDPSRVPRDWMEIIQPGQFAVFASRLDGGQPCDPDGTPTSHDAASCLLVDSLADAERVCEARVQQHPEVRFDIFDSAGRSKPPVATVVHPSHLARLEGDLTSRRRNRLIAIALIVAAPMLMWVDWTVGLLGLPTLAGLNALVFAGRLLQLNAAYSAAEQQRRRRAAGADAAPDEHAGRA